MGSRQFGWEGRFWKKVRVQFDEEPPSLALREPEPSESGPRTPSCSLRSCLVSGKLWQRDISVWGALLSPVGVLRPQLARPGACHHAGR